MPRGCHDIIRHKVITAPSEAHTSIDFIPDHVSWFWRIDRADPAHHVLVDDEVGGAHSSHSEQLEVVDNVSFKIDIL